MALSEQNRHFVVIQVQRILRTLSGFLPEIPLINTDGVFGPETAEAIRAYQNWADIPMTGRIDAITFASLQAVKNVPGFDSVTSLPIRPFDRRLAGDRVSPGDRSDLVLILQMMLRTIRIFYGDIGEVPLDGVYGGTTTQAILAVQKIYDLPETGSVDLLTWNALAQAYNQYSDSEGD